jgi:hypothetical protein
MLIVRPLKGQLERKCRAANSVVQMQKAGSKSGPSHFTTLRF